MRNFGLAMNERWTDAQTGERKEDVTYVDVEAWARQAEVINEHLTKGSPMLMEGSLKFEQWQAEDGTNRNRLRVRLSHALNSWAVMATATVMVNKLSRAHRHPQPRQSI